MSEQVNLQELREQTDEITGNIGERVDNIFQQPSLFDDIEVEKDLISDLNDLEGNLYTRFINGDKQTATFNIMNLGDDFNVLYSILLLSLNKDYSDSDNSQKLLSGILEVNGVSVREEDYIHLSASKATALFMKYGSYFSDVFGDFELKPNRVENNVFLEHIYKLYILKGMNCNAVDKFLPNTPQSIFNSEVSIIQRPQIEKVWSTEAIAVPDYSKVLAGLLLDLMDGKVERYTTIKELITEPYMLSNRAEIYLDTFRSIKGLNE